MNLFTELHEDVKGVAPAKLLDESLTVIKRFDEKAAKALETLFEIRTVRELVQVRVLDWLWRNYDLYKKGGTRSLGPDADEFIMPDWKGRRCGDFYSAPLSALEMVDKKWEKKLREDLGWEFVRDMASSKGIGVAREISRVVTGEPKEDEEENKTLTNFFAGGTEKFINRKREAAGLPARAPSQAVDGYMSLFYSLGKKRNRTPEELEAAQQQYPGAFEASFKERQHQPVKGYAPDGHYVPKGGGSRGWFENQGVAHTEQGNGYRFHQAVDERVYNPDGVEQVYEEERDTDRREMKVHVLFRTGAESQDLSGLCVDISLTGAKVRIKQPLRAGTPVTLQFVDRDGYTGDREVLCNVKGKARWNSAINPRLRSTRHEVGIKFDDMTAEAMEAITMLQTGKYDRLVEMVRARNAPEEGEAHQEPQARQAPQAGQEPKDYQRSMEHFEI